MVKRRRGFLQKIGDDIRKALRGEIQRTVREIADRLVSNIFRPQAPQAPTQPRKRKPRATAPDRLDDLIEEIQTLPISKVRGAQGSKRVIQSTQLAEQELSSTLKPKTIADSLGISVQKWVSIRKGIRSGKIRGVELRDLLNAIRIDNRPVSLDVRIPITGPDGKTTYIQHRLTYFPNEAEFHKRVGMGRDSGKRFFAFSDAKNWWGQTGGAAEYFAIVKLDNGEFGVFDMRTNSEYAERGTLGGDIRALQILGELPEGDEPDE